MNYFDWNLDNVKFEVSMCIIKIIMVMMIMVIIIINNNNNKNNNIRN